jgi:hypothetical protein
MTSKSHPRTSDFMLSKEKQEEVRTKMIETLYHSAEKHRLDKNRVSWVIRMIHYIFDKDPKFKDDRCQVCEKED